MTSVQGREALWGDAAGEKAHWRYKGDDQSLLRRLFELFGFCKVEQSCGRTEAHVPDLQARGRIREYDVLLLLVSQY